MFDEYLKKEKIFVRQKKEFIELIGVETRNKYSIETESGECFAYAAEQGKDFWGVMGRYFLGHFRAFNVTIFDNMRNPVMNLNHPFRWFFPRIDVTNYNGTKIGAIQLKFSFFSKKMDLEDNHGKVIAHIESPIWKIWTFPIIKFGREIATISKKWAGLLQEGFIDADNFLIEFNTSDHNLLNLEERKLILATSIFIDLKYFERKPRNNN